mgnify:FL=1
MVTVKAYHLRKNAEGQTYVSLELVGQVELVQSQNTGRFYATARRCFIYSTLEEKMAAQIVGTSFPGSIVRTPCETYEYSIPESGKQILLSHRYTYIPEESSMEAPVKRRALVEDED